MIVCDTQAEAITKEAEAFNQYVDTMIAQGYSTVIVNGKRQIIGKNAATGHDMPNAQKTVDWSPIFKTSRNKYYFGDTDKDTVVYPGSSSMSALHVDGNLLKDASGKTITLRGVSLGSATNQWNGIPAYERVTAVKALKANVVRIPCQVSQVDGLGVEQHNLLFIDTAVQKCADLGLYCIIDYHAIEDYNTASIDAKLRKFWTYTADRYGKLPHVIFEIFNEPVGPGEWATCKPIMQGWVDFIRKYAPDTVLICGNPGYDQSVASAVASPLTGINLMYTAHYYSRHMPGGQIAEGTTDAAKYAWCDSAFGNAALQVPVIMTEWGYSTRIGDKPTNFNDFGQGGSIWWAESNNTFGVPLKTYLSTRPHIHWTAWSYDPLTGPGMINGQVSGEDGPLTEFGQFVVNWLGE